jgi:hypothetical protein
MNKLKRLCPLGELRSKPIIILLGRSLLLSVLVNVGMCPSQTSSPLATDKALTPHHRKDIGGY